MAPEHKPTTLEKKLFGMTGRARDDLLDRLVKKHTGEDETRPYNGEVTLRTKLVAALREYPQANYYALSLLLFGDETLEHRQLVTSTLALMVKQGGKNALVKKVGRGQWEAKK
jgi:hypothetical protein